MFFEYFNKLQVYFLVEVRNDKYFLKYFWKF